MHINVWHIDEDDTNNISAYQHSESFPSQPRPRENLGAFARKVRLNFTITQALLTTASRAAIQKETHRLHDRC
jgi:hypothetical protein